MHLLCLFVCRFYQRRQQRYHIPKALFHAFVEGGRAAAAREREQQEAARAVAEAAQREEEQAAKAKAEKARKARAERRARLTQGTAGSIARGTHACMYVCTYRHTFGWSFVRTQVIGT